MFARELHPSAFRTIGPPPPTGSGALMAKVTLFGLISKFFSFFFRVAIAVSGLRCGWRQSFLIMVSPSRSGSMTRSTRLSAATKSLKASMPWVCLSRS